MIDSNNRKIDYLRVSLTDLCNLKCKYCSSIKEIKVDHNDVLSIEEYVKVIKCFNKLGITKVRLTGGEPLLKKGIITLIKELSNFIDNISLTTNGILLNDYAIFLKNSGLKSLNISLDTLDKDKYYDLTKGDISKTIEGINKSFELGFNIKINAVLQKDINDCEVLDLLKFASNVNAKLRFIELMPFNNNIDYYKKHYISSEEIIKRYNLIYKYTENTCEYYEYKDGSLIGFIRPISNKFCSSCSRIRLTSFGDVIPCLHNKISYNIKEYMYDEILLTNKLKEIIYNKPKDHNIDKGVYQEIDMQKIGG